MTTGKIFNSVFQTSRFRSLKTRLLVLVLLVWIPALLLVLYSTSAEIRTARRNAQQEALRMAQLAASYQEQVIRGTRDLLMALSELPSVREMDETTCRPLFRDLARQYESYTNLFVVDLEGQTYCSALETDPSPEEVRARSWFQRALELREFSQGDYAIGLVSRRPVVTYSYPILSNNAELTHFIAASVDLGWVSDFISEVQLPPDVSITAIDRNGTILYLYPESDSLVGQSWSDAEMLKAVFDAQTGTIQGTGPTGTDRLYGFAPLASTGTIYVLVGIPTETVSAESNAILLNNLAGLGVVGFVTLLLARYGTERWFLRPLDQLISTSRLLASGDFAARIDLNVTENVIELRQLGAAFNEMAQALESRDQALLKQISERIRAEQALQQAHDNLESQVLARTAELVRSEKRIRLMADALPVLISYVDAQCRYQFNNHMYEQWFGLAREEIVGMPLEALWGREAYEAITPYIETALSGEMVQFESRVSYGDGSMRVIDATYVPDIDEKGTVQGFYALILDISDRKQVEERNRSLLHTTTALSQALTEQDVISATVREGLTSVQGKAAIIAVFDTDPDTLVVIAEHNVPAHVIERYKKIPLSANSSLADAVRGGKPVWVPDLQAYRDLYPESADVIASEAYQAFAALPLIVNGVVIGGISLGFDQAQTFGKEDRDFITTLVNQCAQALERARLYQMERAARLEAERANQLKLQFLGMISHELRTPLTSIKGFSSTLLAPDVDFASDMQKDFIQVIDEEADRLTDLVEELLDLSRIHAGTFGISAQLESTGSLIASALPHLKRLTPEHRLNVEIADDLPPVFADKQRILQVLSNLVQNAVKYSPIGTKILVRVWQSGDAIRIEVSDQGVGIPPAQRELVFEPFRQLNKQRSRGAGLGLAVCRGVIEAHGGRIWIQEQAAPGTTVSFTLPVAQPVETQSA